MSENFVYDVMALISVHDVVALNTYLLRNESVSFYLFCPAWGDVVKE